jgi:hypothetical protein
MNQTLVDKIVQAVLYEGYILYPYRPCVKSQQRWTFGGLFPQAYAETYPFGDAWLLQAQCLLSAPAESAVNVKVRFLHLTDRKVGQMLQPLEQWPEDSEPATLAVGSLMVNGRQYQSWQEAMERDVTPPPAKIGLLLDQPQRFDFAFDGGRTVEPLRAADGQIAGVLAREQQALAGSIETSATRIGNDVYRLTVRVWNRTPMNLPGNAHQSATSAGGAAEIIAQRSNDRSPAPPTRDEALMRSLVSTHAILNVESGQFMSMTDPPAPWQQAASHCNNIGVWPVLVGEAGHADTMLASPIILYDYPQVAPESPGDLFDATEIDEILTLRIMTLTDDEKRTAASTDPRARDLLARTESLAREQLMNLHGTIRGLRPVAEEKAHG